MQEVADGCYQANKIHKKSGSGFVSLPCCNSLLLAAWFFARAFRARDDGTLETSTFKTSMKEVRPLRSSSALAHEPCADSPCVFLCRIGCSAAQGEEQGEE